MAPYNTTQFLLDDREQRTTSADDIVSIDALTNAAAADHHAHHQHHHASGSDAGNTSETASIGDVSYRSDAELEREFEADYDSAKIERLDDLSRLELIREVSNCFNNSIEIVCRCSIWSANWIRRRMRFDCCKMKIDNYVPVVVVLAQ
jgi:hypothetical protein